MKRTLVALGAAAIVSSLLAPVGAQAQAPTCNGLAATTTSSYGTEGDDVYIGSDAGEAFYGEGGNDTICLFGGNDVSDLGPGDDYLDAGEGVDTLYVSDFDGPPVSIDLGAGTFTGDGSDSLAPGSVENVIMNCSVQNDDTIIGDDDPNYISGGMGNDTIDGGGGHDKLFGTDPSYGRTDALCWRNGADDDGIDGGPGNDHIEGGLRNDTLDGGEGADSLDGFDGNDSCFNGERYARCETISPEPPEPECSDGVDNDGDAATDHPEDASCIVPANPTEAVLDDPSCGDGFDNDGDGTTDFPEDLTCGAATDDVEAANDCHPCGRDVSFQADLEKPLWTGRLVDWYRSCESKRWLKVKREDEDRWRLVASVLTTRTGSWRFTAPPTGAGGYRVVAPRLRLRRDGQTTVCEKAISNTVTIP